jgi:hypothetical protein
MAAILIFGSPVPLELSVNPLSASGTTSGTRVGFTNTVTVTPLNGNGPFTYSWTRIDGDVLTAESPSAAATRFTALVPIGEILLATFQCTVTDATGGVGTAEVNATLNDGSWGSYY